MSVISIAQEWQKEFDELIRELKKAEQMILTLSAKLTTAAQTITEKNSLIEHLSKDNLALVAKLDALTGRNKDFSA